MRPESGFGSMRIGKKDVLSSEISVSSMDCPAQELFILAEVLLREGL